MSSYTNHWHTIYPTCYWFYIWKVKTNKISISHHILFLCFSKRVVTFLLHQAKSFESSQWSSTLFLNPFHLQTNIYIWRDPMNKSQIENKVDRERGSNDSVSYLPSLGIVCPLGWWITKGSTHFSNSSKP